MKRMIAGVLLLLLTFSGCSKEIGETIANESEAACSCITVEILMEKRDFGSFAAAPAGEAEAARRLVCGALEQYPEGFPQQWGRVEILLVGELTGREDFAGERYAGFTQRVGDGWLMVLDAERCDAGTVHHEIAHILDGILTEARTLTEAEWMSLCPADFTYGPGDWLAYPDFFADAYAMTDIREDRARTFEEAMLHGPGVYADRPALWLKLDCLSRALRAHFDTAGWPAETAWELALKNSGNFAADVIP